MVEQVLEEELTEHLAAHSRERASGLFDHQNLAISLGPPGWQVVRSSMREDSLAAFREDVAEQIVIGFELPKPAVVPSIPRKAVEVENAWKS